jgi:hypothetical protein
MRYPRANPAGVALRRYFSAMRLRMVDVETDTGSRVSFTHADFSGDTSGRQIADTAFAAFKDGVRVRIDGGPWRDR